jgi:hypothetical protein
MAPLSALFVQTKFKKRAGAEDTGVADAMAGADVDTGVAKATGTDTAGADIDMRPQKLAQTRSRPLVAWSLVGIWGRPLLETRAQWLDLGLLLSDLIEGFLEHSNRTAG